MSNKGFQFFPLQRAYTQILFIWCCYKFECCLCNVSYYGESSRHLDIRSGEHIGVSPLTRRKVKPSSNNAVCDHLLHWTFLPSVDNSIMKTRSIYYKLKKAC